MILLVILIIIILLCPILYPFFLANSTTLYQPSSHKYSKLTKITDEKIAPLEYNGLIYCIGMPDRKNKMKVFFNRIGVESPIFIDPIKSSDYTMQEFYELGYVNDAMWNPKNYNPKGKIACNQSHIKTLNEFLKTDEPYAIVFEDDIKSVSGQSEMEYINMGVKFALEYINDNPDTLLMNLGPCFARCLDRNIKNEFIREHESALCRHAYIITRKGAEIFIQEGSRLDKSPGDVTWSSVCKKHGGCMRTAALFHQDRQETGSYLHSADTAAANNPPFECMASVFH